MPQDLLQLRGVRAELKAAEPWAAAQTQAWGQVSREVF